MIFGITGNGRSTCHPSSGVNRIATTSRSAQRAEVPHLCSIPQESVFVAAGRIRGTSDFPGAIDGHAELVNPPSVPKSFIVPLL